MTYRNFINDIFNINGTFFTLSQYIEDLQRSLSDASLWKVVPSTFSVYSLSKFTNDSFVGELQSLEDNIFSVKEAGSKINGDDFTDYFDNLASALFTAGPYYSGNISTDSYNMHDGIGYNEIVCHIPEDAQNLLDASAESFTFDSLVLYYDIYTTDMSTGSEAKVFENVPLGIYITGIFDDNQTMTNPVTKWYSNHDLLYGSGTSWTLRLADKIINTTNSNSREIHVDILDGEPYSGNIYMEFSENVDKMLDDFNQAVKKTENNYLYWDKMFFSELKNNKINTPYLLNINNIKYWFINGKNTGVPVTADSDESDDSSDDIELTNLSLSISYNNEEDIPVEGTGEYIFPEITWQADYTDSAGNTGQYTSENPGELSCTLTAYPIIYGDSATFSASDFSIYVTECSTDYSELSITRIKIMDIVFTLKVENLSITETISIYQSV